MTHKKETAFRRGLCISLSVLLAVTLAWATSGEGFSRAASSIADDATPMADAADSGAASDDSVDLAVVEGAIVNGDAPTVMAWSRRRMTGLQKAGMCVILRRKKPSLLKVNGRPIPPNWGLCLEKW